MSDNTVHDANIRFLQANARVSEVNAVYTTARQEYYRNPNPESSHAHKIAERENMEAILAAVTAANRLNAAIERDST